ncbi:MAG: hypothetical protein NZ914_10755 [Gemmatales bacterium]|nr:hypothetical protein [Gemmatales bacterium]
MKVPFGLQVISLETEIFGLRRRLSETLAGQAEKAKRGEGQLSAFGIN